MWDTLHLALERGARKIEGSVYPVCVEKDYVKAVAKALGV